MEFNEKLQELRKKKGLTQEELAKSLYVSRTAISKWESGRGYPSIESLKAIAAFFSVTVDELLSSDEILVLAEEDGKQKESRLRELVFGALDLSMSLLFFLPLFAARETGTVQSTSLLMLDTTENYLKILYFSFVIAASLFGVLIFAMQNCRSSVWAKIKTKISLGLGTATVLLFIISLQPYAAVYAFILLAIKVLTLIKSR